MGGESQDSGGSVFAEILVRFRFKSPQGRKPGTSFLIRHHFTSELEHFLVTQFIRIESLDRRRLCQNFRAFWFPAQLLANRHGTNTFKTCIAEFIIENS